MNQSDRKKPSENLSILVDHAKMALLRFGYFAFSSSHSWAMISTHPSEDPKRTSTVFEITESIKEKARSALLKDKNNEIRCNGDVIVSLNRIGLSDTIKTPETVGELLDLFYGSNVKYRGQSDASFNLTPSVFRDDNARRETEFYYACTSRMASEFDASKTIFDILVKLQHYNVPTRLLDVTDSAIIALYFAIENSESPGVIYKFEPTYNQLKKYDSLPVALIASLAKFNKKIDSETLEWTTKNENPSPYNDPEDVALAGC